MRENVGNSAQGIPATQGLQRDSREYGARQMHFCCVEGAKAKYGVKIASAGTTTVTFSEITKRFKQVVKLFSTLQYGRIRPFKQQYGYLCQPWRRNMNISGSDAACSNDMSSIWHWLKPAHWLTLHQRCLFTRAVNARYTCLRAPKGLNQGKRKKCGNRVESDDENVHHR